MLDLPALVAPLAAEEFLASTWPDRAWWSESDPTRAECLAEIAELETVETLLEQVPELYVFKPDGSTGIVKGGKAALPLYKLGLTCYVDGRHIRSLQKVADRITADLGLPAGAMQCEIFCSNGESGAKMHSDFDVNFALLLRGHKRWTIAPNRHIRNQTGLCVPSTRAGEQQPLQLKLADETPFPAAMPDDATVVEVTDGGVVFLPRGWWHETQATGECLQVNFVVKRPMWLTLAGKALEMHLMRYPQWRGYAFDLFGGEERREAAIDELAAMLDELSQAFERMTTGDRREVARRIVEQSGQRPVA